MIPDRIYAKFLENFPDMKNQIVKFYTNRKKLNSIVLVLRNKNRLIFSILEDGTWHLERG